MKRTWATDWLVAWSIVFGAHAAFMWCALTIVEALPFFYDFLFGMVTLVPSAFSVLV